MATLCNVINEVDKWLWQFISTYMQWSVLLATKLTFTKKASQGVYSHRVDRLKWNFRVW